MSRVIGRLGQTKTCLHHSRTGNRGINGELITTSKVVKDNKVCGEKFSDFE